MSNSKYYSPQFERLGEHKAQEYKKAIDGATPELIALAFGFQQLAGLEFDFVAPLYLTQALNAQSNPYHLIGMAASLKK